MKKIYSMRKFVWILTFVFPLYSILVLIRFRYRLPFPAKSAIVLCTLLVAAGAASLLLAPLIKYRKEYHGKIFSIFCVVFSFAVILAFSPYLLPHRTPSLALQEVIVSEQKSDDRNGWWCLYDFSVLGMEFEDGAGFLPQDLKIEDLDLDNYMYLFSPGYEVESIRYNMWDIYPWDLPIVDLGYSRRFAQITTKGEWQPDKIYVYKLEKTAIQNIYFTKFRDYEEFEYLM